VSIASIAGNPPLPASPVTYILDSSAVLRYMDREAGHGRVRAILDLHSKGDCRVVMTSLHWGELANKLVRWHGEALQERAMAKLVEMGIEIVPADADRAVRSARIQARLRIPFVDCFGVELAYDSFDHVFVTADFDMQPAASEVRIEFLPVK